MAIDRSLALVPVYAPVQPAAATFSSFPAAQRMAVAKPRLIERFSVEREARLLTYVLVSSRGSMRAPSQ